MNLNFGNSVHINNHRTKMIYLNYSNLGGFFYEVSI